MKFIFLPLIFNFLVHLSCEPKKEAIIRKSANNNSLSEKMNDSVAVEVSLKNIVQLVGKKPKDVQLFEKFSLNERLEKLLGSEFTIFRSEWNEETPIESDGEFAYFTGCKAGACAENKYFILLDLVDNNINVINFKNKKSRSFEEGAIIGMTTKIGEYFDKIRLEQGL